MTDLRIKIPKTEYPAIKSLHTKGIAIREIARSYSVDHRLIQFILFPERHKRNIELRKERGGSKIYYNKDKCREVMRRHRAHKKQVALNQSRQLDISK